MNRAWEEHDTSQKAESDDSVLAWGLLMNQSNKSQLTSTEADEFSIAALEGLESARKSWCNRDMSRILKLETFRDGQSLLGNFLSRANSSIWSQDRNRRRERRGERRREHHVAEHQD
jgi:hypothetical protein